jgi:hypothetical protein
MPYPIEHVAKLVDPEAFQRESFRRKKLTEGIEAVYAKRKGGNKMEVQSYRFANDKFSSSEAKAWLKDNKISSKTFEAAKDEWEDDGCGRKTKRKDDSAPMKVKRFDAGEITSLTETDEGFIRGFARVTRTGVFYYRNADGTTRRELRHPDDVFNLDSLNSMKMIPITNLHPESRLVTADTAKQLSIGYTGESFIPDGKFVRMPIVVTDREGIEAVKNGREELSLGYEVELDEVPGTYDGVEYDYRQRNIRYNHLAIVDKGRAGPDVRLNTDEAEQISDYNNDKDKQSSQPRSEIMPKLRLDNGCEYEAPQEVIAAVEGMRKQIADTQVKLDEANTAVEKQKAAADTATETAKKLKERVDGLDKEIAAAVSNRISLERTANTILGGEVKLDAMSDLDIRKAIIKNQFPEAKLDDQTEAYIDARYDAAIELHTKNDEEDNSAAQQRKTVNTDVSSSGSIEDKVLKSRNDMIAAMTNAYKGEANK